MTDHDLDILFVSDFRYPGGTSSSQVQEMRAATALGFRCGLMHVHAYNLRRQRPFHAGIQGELREGRVRLVLPTERVRTRLTMVRNPSVFQQEPAIPLRIDTEHLLLLVNQAPQDATTLTPFYEVPHVDELLERVLGLRPLWAPIGPFVRDSFLRAPGAGGVSVRAEDWTNIIDVREWRWPRDRFVADRPVLGRHSRGTYKKWPATRADLLAAYPDDPAYRVRVLGGADPAAALLGGIPANWEVLPFNSVTPREFLGTIDFFVYFHNPDQHEAFGRAILEAISSGCVAILPPHFRVTFGDAGVYTEPAGVRAEVDDLYSSIDRYRATVDRALGWVRESCSYEAFAARLEPLLGSAPAGGGAPSAGGVTAPAAARTPAAATAPSTSPAPGSGEPAEPREPGPGAPRILLVSSNGVGLGHLTRIFAIARRLAGRAHPVVFTLCDAYDALRAHGIPVEHLVSREASGLPAFEWNELFSRRLVHIVEGVDPAVVVFDGTNPYDGFADARASAPGTTFVWSRRGRWQRGVADANLRRARMFDVVLEPGELGEPVPPAGTSSREPLAGADVLRIPVAPITLFAAGELLDAPAARRSLGLPEPGPHALVDLTDIDPAVRAARRRLVVDELRSVLPGVHVAVAGHARGEREPAVEGAVPLHRYPLGDHLRAFDVAVSSVGYNTAHELALAGVPTLLVPNEGTQLDDQRARAQAFASAGVAVVVDDVSPAPVRAALQQLTSPGFRVRPASGTELARDGAGEAADWLLRLARGGAGTARRGAPAAAGREADDA